MKRRYAIALASLTVVAVLAFFNQALASTIVDSYSETNSDQSEAMSAALNALQAMGQSFTGDGSTLDSSKFYLAQNGTAPGTAVSKIYNYSGTPGTNALPSGAALATSDTVTVSTISASPTFQLVTFTFTGANRITLTNGTNYIVTVEYNAGDNTNRIRAGWDSSSATHSGNKSRAPNGVWAAGGASDDTVFYVYGTLPPVALPSPQSNSQLQGATVVTDGMMVTK